MELVTSDFKKALISRTPWREGTSRSPFIESLFKRFKRVPQIVVNEAVDEANDEPSPSE